MGQRVGKRQFSTSGILILRRNQINADDCRNVQLNAVLTSGKLRESNKSREACADDRIDHSGPAAYSAWVAEAGSYEDRRTAKQRGRARFQTPISPRQALTPPRQPCYTSMLLALLAEMYGSENFSVF